ncbi:cupin domain-containing protein [Stakelama sp. CBK3Z-3]|uniref:Cupin domain-containing protein n=1 Tax=Stakelama flava TaxID=2860338 RepID=A0ABS6XNJ2_9SPHN|nr:cupin domain-containing protein [Stakelama flava]MBW4331005.1 cupin domain-containing protein [Stakelama flava]
MSDIGAEQLIATLDLSPHPEGGWFRETWRAEAKSGDRAGGTAILFLLDADQASHWHRVDADEIWLWHSGAPLSLDMARDDAGPVETLSLGIDIANGQSPQQRVPAGWWQAAHPNGGWTLVSCIVVPGFEFSGFELAAPGWAPGLA